PVGANPLSPEEHRARASKPGSRRRGRADRMARARVSVDIAADMGESFGPWPMGRDADIAPHLTSAHIACGFHASDPGTIRTTIKLLQLLDGASGAARGHS